VRVLRGIFGFKKKKLTGGWRELHSGEFHNLYSSINIVRMNRSWRMRWPGLVAHMGGKKVPTEVR
jgi:hypothetical protein